jgi:hypothetical protein
VAFAMTFAAKREEIVDAGTLGVKEERGCLKEM